jgi:hypothetical protein
MQQQDLDTIARNRRVQELCGQLTRLVRLSREQRSAIDRLLAELEEVTRRVVARPLVRAAGAGRGTSGSDAGRQ